MTTPVQSLTFITNIWTPYRAGLFRQLARTPGVDFSAIYLKLTESRRSWLLPGSASLCPWETVLDHTTTTRRQSRTMQLRLWRLLTALRPEIVVATGYGSWATVTAIAWCRRFGSRCFIWDESHGMAFNVESAGERCAKSLLAEAASGVLVPGRAAHVFQTQCLRVPARRVHVVGDPVDNAHFASAIDDETLARRDAGIPLDATVYLYVGRVEAEKGIHLLLRAFCGLADAASMLVVAGGEPALDFWNRDPRVRWLGFVPQEQLPRVYAAADVFVFPTLGDVWGLAVNEAMAAGLPVVCSRFAGCWPDLITPPSGVVVDPRNVRELRDRMSAMGFHRDRTLLRGHALHTVADMTFSTTAARILGAVNG